MTQTQPTDLCQCGHARSAHSEDYGNACFAEIRIWKTCHCLSFTPQPQPESEAKPWTETAPVRQESDKTECTQITAQPSVSNAGESSDPTPQAKAHKGYQNTFERIWDESDYSLPPEPQPVDPVQESTVEGTLSAMEEWVSGIRDSTDAERNAIDECLAEELAQPVDGKEEHPIIERALFDFAQEVIKTQKERIVALELESDGYAVRDKVLREWLAKVDVALATVTRDRDEARQKSEKDAEDFVTLGDEIEKLSAREMELEQGIRGKTARLEYFKDRLSSERSAHEQTKRELAEVVAQCGRIAMEARAKHDDLARQLAEAKESLEWANKTVDGQRETMTKAIEGASSAEKRNDSLTRQLAEAKREIAKKEKEYESAQKSAASSSAQHSHALAGMLEARADRESLRVELAEQEARHVAGVKAAFEEGWAMYFTRPRLDYVEAWLNSSAFRALGKAE